MSLPKLSDFMGKSLQNVEYKRISVIHALNNSLTRNVIPESYKSIQKTLLVSSPKRQSVTDRKNNANDLNYQQKMSSSLLFTPDDLHKLLEHLFKKNFHDINDRNFIRRLLLKYFPENLIYSANKDFISCLKYQKIYKNQVIYFSDKLQTKEDSQKFYFLLKGKVKINIDQNSEEKISGEYFGQLQIMGNKFIREIHAKSDTMLLSLDKKDFQRYFLKHFKEKYDIKLKKNSRIEPLLNLVPEYNKLRIMNLVEEKQFKTGQKVLAKGEPINQITFMNNCAMSYSQDKILSEYKTVGLTEIVTMQNPFSKDNVYCMENNYLFTINVESFLVFLPRKILQKFLLNNFSLQTINNSKTPNSKQTICYDRTSIIQSFIKVKRVKFIGQKTRFATEPSSRSKSNITPIATQKKTPKYPEYMTSFIFLKKQNGQNQKSLYKRHQEIKKTQNSKYKELKEYFLKTRQSLKKKRWLDEMQLSSQNSVIYNPEKTIERTRETLE